MNHSFEIYCELYKRGEYGLIPIGSYPNGELFYPTVKQVKALHLLNDDTTTFTGYGGSARSGKSIIECVAIIFDSFCYPGIAWGLGRKELTVLKRTVLLTMFKQLSFYEISEKEDYTYNQQLNTLTFNNGSQVFLIDTISKPSDPLNTRFGGFELTRCAIDESNETAISVVNTLFERTGWRKNDTYNLKRKVFECFNPAKNHVYSRYYLPYRNETESSHKKFIAALPSDNPHPSVKEWVDDMIENGDKTTIERQVYGNFDYDNDPSALCDYDAITDMFTNIVPKGQKYISADLAMQGRDKFIGGYWEGLNCYIEVDQAKSTGRSIELALKQVKIEKGVMNSNIVADADGLGNYIESYIENIKSFHGNNRAVDSQYANIKSECGFKLAEMINQGLIRIHCTKEQEEAIKEEVSACLKRDKIDADNQKKRLIHKAVMKEKLGRSPDYLDMLLMRMIFEVVHVELVTEWN